MNQARQFPVRLRLPAILALAGLYTLLPESATAQVVPYYSVGEGALYNTNTQEYVGAGRGIRVGYHRNSGRVGEILPTGNEGEFTWTTDGPHVVTAADGSKIFLKGGGTLQFIPLGGGRLTAVWNAIFTVEGGTGRFASVGPGPEPIIVTAVNEPFFFDDPFWKFSWSIRGPIDLGKGRGK